MLRLIKTFNKSFFLSFDLTDTGLIYASNIDDPESSPYPAIIFGISIYTTSLISIQPKP